MGVVLKLGFFVGMILRIIYQLDGCCWWYFYQWWLLMMMLVSMMVTC